MIRRVLLYTFLVAWPAIPMFVLALIVALCALGCAAKTLPAVAEISEPPAVEKAEETGPSVEKMFYDDDIQSLVLDDFPDNMTVCVKPKWNVDYGETYSSCVEYRELVRFIRAHREM